MTVFSNLQEAIREGFNWLEYQPSTQLHLVEKSMTRKDGLKIRALAFAKATQPPPVPAHAA